MENTGETLGYFSVLRIEITDGLGIEILGNKKFGRGIVIPFTLLCCYKEFDSCVPKIPLNLCKRNIIIYTFQKIKRDFF